MNTKILVTVAIAASLAAAAAYVTMKLMGFETDAMVSGGTAGGVGGAIAGLLIGRKNASPQA